MGPRVALCQDWVMTRSGSESVAGHLARVLDVEDVYTFAARPELLRKYFGDRRVRTSRAGSSNLARDRWHWLLPVMDAWWRRLDLTGYDAVVTSSHAVVNAVRVPDRAVHISYCHTPMRYAWEWRAELGRVPPPLRRSWPAIAAVLRAADRRRARAVDLFIANSHNVARRIEHAYGRRSVVVYPPVDTVFYTPDPDVPRGDFYLYAGRLVSYKQPDVVVRAATAADVPLVVAGSGPELERLRGLAGPSVGFVAEPDDDTLRTLYRGARALVFAGEEDFGMTLVEAQACGTPVIAIARGGALEAVRDGQTGTLLEDASVEGLAAEMRSFDPSRFDPATLSAHAAGFSVDRFEAAIRGVVGAVLDAPGHQRAEVIESLLTDTRQ